MVHWWVLVHCGHINSVKIHPQLVYNRHPLDGALVGAGSLWPPQDTSWTADTFVLHVLGL
jgi:hypothetical protein